MRSSPGRAAKIFVLVQCYLSSSTKTSTDAFVSPSPHSLPHHPAMATTRTTRSTPSTLSHLYSSNPSYGQRWEPQTAGSRTTMDEGNYYEPRERDYEQRERDPMPRRFPREREAAPMTRYSPQRYQDALPPPLQDERPFFARDSYRDMDPEFQSSAAFQSPNPPLFQMPMNSKEIQGGSRGTWISHDTLEHDHVTVKLMTPDGRPLKADVEVYNGPSNTPQKMRIYSEDGRYRPFTTLIATPSGASKTHALIKDWESPMSNIRGPGGMGGTTSHSISVKNTGSIEFPIVAGVEGGGTVPNEERAARMADFAGRMAMWGKPKDVQGGSLQTFPFDPSVASVRVELHSEGLPIMAVLELWNGPGDVKTVAQIYNDDGQTKPFVCILETPGQGNVIAIRNVGPTTYPFQVELQVHAIDDGAYSYPYNPNTSAAPTNSLMNGGVGGGRLRY